MTVVNCYCVFSLANLSVCDACCVVSIVWLQPVYNADFVIPVEIDGNVHQVSLLL